MIHVLLGPADFDARIQCHLDCLYWRDDLSVGPVPTTKMLADLSSVRENFWNAPTELRRLQDSEREKALNALNSEDAKAKAARLLADRTLAERDKLVAGLASSAEIVIWCGHNRQEILMLCSFLYFLEPALVKNGQVALVRCPKWGPQVHGANQLATFFDSRQTINLEFAELTAEAWTTYTKPDPFEMNGLTQRLRERFDPLATVFSWILEEHPSVHKRSVTD